MPDLWDSDDTPWAGLPVAIPPFHPVLLRADPENRGTASNDFFQIDAIALTETPPTFEAVDFYLEKEGLILEAQGISPSQVKLITMVYPILSGPRGTIVEFYFGGQVGQPEDDINYIGPYQFIIGTTRKIDCLVTCRYAAFKMYVSTTEEVTLEAIGFDFEVIGED